MSTYEIGEKDRVELKASLRELTALLLYTFNVAGFDIHLRSFGIGCRSGH